MTAMSVMMYFLMRPEIKEFKGSKQFYRKELAQMGRMTYEEKVIGIAFLAVVDHAVPARRQRAQEGRDVVDLGRGHLDPTDEAAGG